MVPIETVAIYLYFCRMKDKYNKYKLINFSEWGARCNKKTTSLRSLHWQQRNRVFSLENSKTWQDAADALQEHLANVFFEEPFEVLRFFAIKGLVVSKEPVQSLSYKKGKILLKEFGKRPVWIQKDSPLVLTILEDLCPSPKGKG